MSNKKKMQGGAWTAPALALSLAALLSSCSIFSERPAVYADWRARNITLTSMSERYIRLPPYGERVELGTLSDGTDAIEITCATRSSVVTARDMWTALIVPEITQRQEERDRLAAEDEEIRRWCIDEALRVCRVHTWNGNSTFALMDEWLWFDPNGGKSLSGRKMYVRCLTPQAYKEWATR